VNKSTGEVQQDMGINTGLRPLAEFFQEIFTDVIQVDSRLREPSIRNTLVLIKVDERGMAESQMSPDPLWSSHCR